MIFGELALIVLGLAVMFIGNGLPDGWEPKTFELVVEVEFGPRSQGMPPTALPNATCKAEFSAASVLARQSVLAPA